MSDAPARRYLPITVAVLVTALSVVACSKPAPDAKDGKDAADATAEPAKILPVVTALPTAADFPHAVLIYGSAVPDGRENRVIASSTSVEVRGVAVLAGARVHRGEVLLSIVPDPTAFLAHEQAASALKLAQAEVERLTAQRAEQLATTSQVETAQKALVDARAALAAARSQGADAAVVELRTPIDAIVTSIPVAAGDRIAAGAPLATLSPVVLDHVTLEIEPAEQQAVRIGDHVRLHPAHAPKIERAGRVAAVGAAVDKDSKLLPVSVALEHGAGQDWLAGAALEGTIDGKPSAGYALPRSALVKDEHGLAVFEVVDGHARRVAVELLSEDGERVGVAGELDVRRPVVAVGAYELDDGVAVQERKP